MRAALVSSRKVERWKSRKVPPAPYNGRVIGAFPLSYSFTFLLLYFVSAESALDQPVKERSETMVR
jgi:hypothetical protein